MPTTLTPQPACWALVPAAGSGRRMGAQAPKQYLELGGRTVLEHTLAVLAADPAIEGVVLVGDRERWPAGLEAVLGGKPLIGAEGGAERCHSVLNGLRRLAAGVTGDPWVLVHDAARPCLRAADLRHLVVALAEHPVGGLLAVPASDTLKRADAALAVRETLDRSDVWHAQTPQMFRLALLSDALGRALQAGHEVTDESSAVEFAGHRPLLVEGHADNIKITRPEHLALAEFHLRQQGRL
ncbi:MAG TPA: 2-C-methyl-D-erythritol 4-phosphate cytidylyltransferase [Gammaproteobacteria bacterium]|nr:2-C-methyl-D-erythritol 4-phosphate cytidylyltransferase [Gammaproteobacteria bacterium]